MHIDWFVFFAQIVNLLILLFLLKKFLFGRIVAAMKAREARISSLFAEAEMARQEAERLAEEIKRKKQELDEQYSYYMEEMRREAEEYREKLHEKAREEVEFLKKRWIDALESQKVEFLLELRKLTGSHVYTVARRVLKDLADIDLEVRIVELLLKRLASLKGEKDIHLFQKDGDGKEIVIAFGREIPEPTKKKIEEKVRRCLPGEVEIIYEHSESILSGCEIRSNGHKIAWSVNDYLENLEERFFSLLQEEIQEWR